MVRKGMLFSHTPRLVQIYFALVFGAFVLCAHAQKYDLLPKLGHLNVYDDGIYGENEYFPNRQVVVWGQEGKRYFHVYKSRTVKDGAYLCPLTGQWIDLSLVQDQWQPIDNRLIHAKSQELSYFMFNASTPKGALTHLLIKKGDEVFNVMTPILDKERSVPQAYRFVSGVHVLPRYSDPQKGYVFETEDELAVMDLGEMLFFPGGHKKTPDLQRDLIVERGYWAPKDDNIIWSQAKYFTPQQELGAILHYLATLHLTRVKDLDVPGEQHRLYPYFGKHLFVSVSDKLMCMEDIYFLTKRGEKKSVTANCAWIDIFDPESGKRFSFKFAQLLALLAHDKLVEAEEGNAPIDVSGLTPILFHSRQVKKAMRSYIGPHK